MLKGSRDSHADIWQFGNTLQMMCVRTKPESRVLGSYNWSLFSIQVFIKLCSFKVNQNSRLLNHLGLDKFWIVDFFFFLLRMSFFNENDFSKHKFYYLTHICD